MNSASIFLRQLRYWTLHCSLCATPSFIIASYWLKLPISPMLAAVGTFILLFTATTTAFSPLSKPEHILARSLKLGTKIRAWISVLTVSCIFSAQTVPYTLDYWCGAASILALDKAGLDVFVNYSFSRKFSDVYLITLLEGFILSFILLFVSFGSLIFLQARDRKKWFLASAAP